MTVETRRRVRRDHKGQRAAPLGRSPPRLPAGQAKAQRQGPPQAVTAMPSLPPVRPAVTVQRVVLWFGFRLFVEPDRRQILVDEMAWADLPAIDIGVLRHDPIPPDRTRCASVSRCASRIRASGVLLPGRSRAASSRTVRPFSGPRIGHNLVDRARQIGCTSSSGLTMPWQLPSTATSKSPLRSAANHGPVGTTRCVTLTPILLH